MGRLVLSLSPPAHHALRTTQKLLGNGGKRHIQEGSWLKCSTRSITTASTVASNHVEIPGTTIDAPRAISIEQSRRAAIKNAKPFSDFLIDTYNRQHNYLRISLTERCNLRCLYCMPEEGVPLSPPDHTLTTPEIFYLSSLFVSQGVTKIRLTGGEPTVRRDILPLMHQIGSLRSKGLTELAITTNGIALHRKLDSMAEAGLTGVNLSLDTLDSFQFQVMTRRKGFDAVWKSIERILEMNKLGAGIKLKVNCVVMRGLNDREIIPFVELGREKDIETRFIEYMPFGGNKWSKGKMLPYQEMLDIIRSKYPGLQKVQDHKNDTSKTFQIPGFLGKMGFITSMTHNFCGTCNRLRITSDGNLKVCLFGNEEVSLRDILRKGNNDQPIDEAAFEALKQIEMDRHQGLLPEGTSLGWGEREKELLNVIGAAVKRKEEGHAVMGELEHMKNRPMILIGEQAQVQNQDFNNWTWTSQRRNQSCTLPTAAPWITTPLHFLQGTPKGPLDWRASYTTNAKPSKSRIIVTSGLRARKAVPSQAWRFVRGEKRDLLSPKEIPLPPAEVTPPRISFSKDSYDQLVETAMGEEPPFATIMMFSPNADRYTLVQSQDHLRRLRVKLASQVPADEIEQERVYVYDLGTQLFKPLSSFNKTPAIRLLYRRLLMKSSSSFRRIGDLPGLSGQTLHNLQRKKFPPRKHFYFRSVKQNPKQRTAAIIEAKAKKRIKSAQILALKKVTFMAQQREKLMASQTSSNSEPESRERLGEFQISARPLMARTKAVRRNLRRASSKAYREQAAAKAEEHRERAAAKVQSTLKHAWTVEPPPFSGLKRLWTPEPPPFNGSKLLRFEDTIPPLSEESKQMSSDESPAQSDQEHLSSPDSTVQEAQIQITKEPHTPTPQDPLAQAPQEPQTLSPQDPLGLVEQMLQTRTPQEPPTEPPQVPALIQAPGEKKPQNKRPTKLRGLVNDPLDPNGTKHLYIGKYAELGERVEQKKIYKLLSKRADLRERAEARKLIALKRQYTIDPPPFEAQKVFSFGSPDDREPEIPPPPVLKGTVRPSFLGMYPQMKDKIKGSAPLENEKVFSFGYSNDWEPQLPPPPVSYGITRPSFLRTHPQTKAKKHRSRSSKSRSYSTRAPEPPPPELTHLDTSGAAHMVSITSKSPTPRRAVATGRIAFSNASPAALIARNAVKKGDVLAVARVAGIMAAKRTPDLIPLCHPVALSGVVVELVLREHGGQFGHIDVTATVECTGPTGVEMEALMAVWGAAATVYDMCKAVDKGMHIEGVKVVLKEGGRSGVFVDGEWDAARRVSSAPGGKSAVPPGTRGFSTAAVYSAPVPPGERSPPPSSSAPPPPAAEQQQQAPPQNMHPYYAQQFSRGQAQPPKFSHSVTSPASPANDQNSLLLMLPLAVLIAVLGGAIVFRRVYTKNADPNVAFEKGMRMVGPPVAKTGKEVQEVNKAATEKEVEVEKLAEGSVSATGKVLVIAMLVVWPVLHILWILTNSRD